MRLPNLIMDARHVMGVRSADDYRRRLRENMAAKRAAWPDLGVPEPFVSPERPDVVVDGGAWKIRCVSEGCANYPAVAPEWNGLACCYDCGAIYEGLTLPTQAVEIAAILVLRPTRRGWRPGEKLEQLRAENRAIGVPTGGG